MRSCGGESSVSLRVLQPRGTWWIQMVDTGRDDIEVAWLLETTYHVHTRLANETGQSQTSQASLVQEAEVAVYM